MSTDTSSIPAVDIVVESGAWDAGAEEIIRRAIPEAAAALGRSLKGHVVSVLLTDDAAVRRLNAQWRNIDKPTNVLSFPPAPNARVADGEPASLGDIAIAYETTAREAQEEHKPFADHVAHLAVHGFLHLLGYDHESDGEAEAMEQLERVILGRLGVPDPYRVATSLTHDIQG